MLRSASFQHLVAIGTSTGGPRALQQLITRLPESFLAPILIVQHMPPKFTKSLALRLDSLSKIKVVEAEDESIITSGTAYIAPGGWHMTLVKKGAQYQIRLSKEELRSGHRPSVDTMFESLVPHHELERHIVIMTGMGSDGAKGMSVLIESGVSSTIVEAEESCVVYGMPRAAVELNQVDYVLPLEEISSKLIELVQS
ncbi:MAG TPA: CheB methylesterase domain-containing protein [Bacilli bacterium]